MAEKLDKLGRRIPKFDRSKAAKKAHATRKERHGEDEWRNANSRGGKHSTRGYFGHLKDTGQKDALKAISKAGNKKSNEAQAKKRADSVLGVPE